MRWVETLDIVGITEVFGLSKSEYSLPGYHPLEFKTRHDTNDSRGGIGVFIKDTFEYKIRQDISIFIPHVFESLFLELSFDHHKVFVGVVYRPNTYPHADIEI